MDSEVTLVQVEHCSFEYFEAVRLREEVLRRPLGLTLSAEDLESESDHSFFVALSGLEVVGCLMLTPPSPEGVQMRQVAVLPDFQGLGIGRRLVQLGESSARAWGVKRIFLHARANAIPFYERLDYQVSGEPFVEVGVPHRFMSKNLS